MHEEHRLVLGVERVDVPHPVELLVGPGELVHAHTAGVVVGHRHHGDDPGLHDRPHHLAVDGVGRHGVAKRTRAFDGSSIERATHSTDAR